MNTKERAYALIRLDALAANYQRIRRLCGAKTKILAAVKADAYGHGAIAVARRLIDEGVDYLAVACYQEGNELRAEFPQIPILVLGYVSDDELSFAIEKNLTLTVYDRESAEKISAVPSPLVISSGGETLRINRDEILYAEAFLHYIALHTENGEYRIKESFGAFENKLGQDFFRCHRSYIVSLRAIAKISRSSVTLSNGQELPLSRGKYDDINRAYIRMFS